MKDETDSRMQAQNHCPSNAPASSVGELLLESARRRGAARSTYQRHHKKLAFRAMKLLDQRVNCLTPAEFHDYVSMHSLANRPTPRPALTVAYLYDRLGGISSGRGCQNLADYLVESQVASIAEYLESPNGKT